MYNQKIINLSLQLDTYSEDDMNKICEPLKLLGFHHFHFLKIFADHSRISLCNNKGWLEYFYQTELFKLAYYTKEKKYQNEARIWYDINEAKPVLQARELYKVTNNGLTVVINKLDSCNLYHFATTKKERAELFSNNNFELSYRFISYFNEQAHSLIKNATKLKFAPEAEQQTSNSSDLSNDIDLFKKKTDCNKIYVEEYDCYLTKHEMNVIKQYINGSTCQLIAKNNFVSPHTIQTHINNIKSKLRCKKSSELFHVLQQVIFI